MIKALSKKQKGTANKGFSLVELIIVIAVMAVLIAVLAPQFIKYVEQSRITKDENSAEELFRTVQTVIAEDAVYNEVIGNTTTTVTLSFDAAGAASLTYNATGTGAATTAISAAVASIYTPANAVSNLHKNDTFAIVLTPDATTGIAISAPTNGVKAVWTTP